MRRGLLPTPARIALVLFSSAVLLAPTAGWAARRSTSRHGRPLPPGGVYAEHAVAIDPETGGLLFGKDPERQVPIASITKLMTALVVLDQNPDLSQPIAITREDRRGAGRSHLRVREQMYMDDLLHMSLMISDNCATRALARGTGLPDSKFVEHMNAKAAALGLSRTQFVEPTGLNPGNVSTAVEVAQMLRVASESPLLSAVMAKRSYSFVSPARRRFALANTNRLVYDRYEIVGGKTGHIGAAGYCVATWLRHQGREMIAVVLGAPNSPTRFNDVRRIVRRVEAEHPVDPQGRDFGSH